MLHCLDSKLVCSSASPYARESSEQFWAPWIEFQLGAINQPECWGFLNPQFFDNFVCVFFFRRSRLHPIRLGYDRFGNLTEFHVFRPGPFRVMMPPDAQIVKI